MKTRRSESGSSYVIVLLILLVLSVIALSLTFVTTIEMRIGANERSLQRTFAAAESGIGMAAARMLVTNDYSEGSFSINADADGTAPAWKRSGVEIGPVMPLIEAPCRLCEINNSGTYGAATYSRVHVAATTRGRRPGLAGKDDQRLLSATLDVQPIQVPATAYYPIGEYDRDELAEKVRF
jgi:Tfp pilus assembly protein PilX